MPSTTTTSSSEGYSSSSSSVSSSLTSSSYDDQDTSYGSDTGSSRASVHGAKRAGRRPHKESSNNTTPIRTRGAVSQSPTRTLDDGAGSDYERPSDARAGSVPGKGSDASASAARAHKHEHKHGPKPNRFAALIARRPYLVMATTLVFTLTLIIVAFAADTFELEALGTFYARDEQISIDSDAFRARFENDNTLTEVPQQSLGDSVSIIIEYEDVAAAGSGGDGTAGDLLTESRIALIEAVEAKVRAIPRYEEFCFKPQDGVFAGEPVPADSPGGCAPFESIVEVLRRESGEATLAGKVAAVARNLESTNGTAFGADVLPVAFSAADPRAPVLRTRIRFGLPLAGYRNARDNSADQISDFSDWATDVLDLLVDERSDSAWGDAGVDFYYAGTAVTGLELQRRIFMDLLLVSMSIIVVFFLMWLQTWSFFLAAMGLVQVLFAFPLAYFIFRYILQIEVFTSINLLGLFVVLGIGADDVFVVTDAWKRTRHEAALLDDIELRFSVAWVSSAKAMAVTSLTTFVAFLASATTSIPAVRTFGIFSALSVVANYFLVITLFASSIMVYHRNFEYRYCCCCSSKWSEDAPENTPHAAFGVDGPRAPQHGGPALGAAPAPLPPIGSKSAAPASQAAPGGGGGGAAAAAAASSVHSAKVSPSAAEDGRAGSFGPGDGDELHNIGSYRYLERAFHLRVAPAVQRFRFPILAFFFVLIVGSIVASTFLEPPETEPSGLPSGHPVKDMIRIDGAFRTSFGGDDAETDLYLVWGITGIDRAGFDPNDQENVGFSEFDASFDVSSEAAQSAVVAGCDRLDAQTDRLVPDLTVCPMVVFQEWLAANASRPAFPVPQGQFNALFSEFSADTAALPALDYFSWKSNDRSQGLKWIAASFVTQVNDQSPHSEVRDAYEHFRDEAAAIGAETGSTGIGTPFVTKQAFVWMRTSEILGSLAQIGIIVSLVLAFAVLLLTTHNIILACLALTSLGGIMATSVGLIVVSGMKLAFSEAIAISILGGLAVDYNCHVCIGYVEGYAEPTRFARMRRAMTELGISITGGACTTLAATCLLLAAAFPFFSVFATVIFILIITSYVYAVTFLPALLATLGPLGKTGDWWNWIATKMEARRIASA